MLLLPWGVSEVVSIDHFEYWMRTILRKLTDGHTSLKSKTRKSHNRGFISCHPSHWLSSLSCGLIIISVGLKVLWFSVPWSVFWMLLNLVKNGLIVLSWRRPGLLMSLLWLVCKASVSFSTCHTSLENYTLPEFPRTCWLNKCQKVFVSKALI